MRLKHLLRLQYGSALAADVRESDGVVVYGSNGPVGSHNKGNMRPPAIVVGRKGSHGKVIWANDGGYCIDTALFVDQRYSKANLRYAFYLLQALGLDEPSKDSAVPGLDRFETHNKPVPDIAGETQKAIADFLDRETNRIDQLIEKKQRMVELLEEKRGVVPLECLSNGLEGFDWLSDKQSVAFRFKRASWAEMRVKSVVGFMTSGSRGWSNLIASDGEVSYKVVILAGKWRRIYAIRSACGLKRALKQTELS
jgi:hypothetical protein